MFGSTKKIKYIRLNGVMQSRSTTESDASGSIYRNVVFVDADGDRFEVDRLIVPAYLIEELERGKPAEYYFAKIQGGKQVVAFLVAMKAQQRSIYRKTETESILGVLIRGLSVRHSLMKWYALTAVIGGWILWAIVGAIFSWRGGLIGGTLMFLTPVLWATWLIYPTIFWKRYGNTNSLESLLASNMVSDVRSANSGKY